MIMKTLSVEMNWMYNKKTISIQYLSRVKAGFESVPLHQYFEFCATLEHWLAHRFQNKIEEEHLKAKVYLAKIFTNFCCFFSEKMVNLLN